ncbi:helix-turn-helix domain-containing protein [Bremerella alba]|uniref:Helix-turn-helix domain-containing protein n=1 Tax=Bremerella alba TaxID=980252 RepID=A0A7V8V8U7_9BACT|nr:helix-turn-helix domain-containing protein [Bremerella alba]MBA2116829.1 hypothetical protein [Bremerella alba]
MSDDPLLTVTQVADLLTTSTATVRRWLGKGELPGMKLRKQWRVRKSDAEGMLTGQDKQDKEAAKSKLEVSEDQSHIAYLESLGIKVR